MNNKIPIINEKDIEKLIELALKNEGVLTAPTELSQMIINVKGVSINSKPRKDGRYQGYLLDNGVKKYVYGKTREEVALILKEYLKNGVPKKKKSHPLKVGEWLEKWVKLYKEPNLKPKSLIALKNALKPIFLAFGDKPLNQLKTDELQAFFLGMKAERVRDMSILYLRSAYDKAIKQGLIKHNPCNALEIKAHKKVKKTALTIEEQSTLLKAVDNTSFKPLFCLLLTTGIRIGEALALTLQDVDFNAKTIYINKNVVFVGKERILQDSTKSDAGVRTIPVPQKTLDLLPKVDGELFPLTYNAVRLFFRRITEKTGIEVTAHTLRHTYATRLEEAGVSPKVKQYLLGHSTLEVTQNIYTDVQKSYIDTFSERISSVFDI